MPSCLSKNAFKFSREQRFPFNSDKSNRTIYNIPSLFTNPKRGRQYTFGVEWKAYRKVYVKSKPSLDSTFPGPGTYDINPQCFSSNVRNITIKPKNNYNHFNKVPGPGYYDADTSSFNSTKRQFNSKFLNSTTIRLFKAQRFSSEKHLSPDPGRYFCDTKSLLSNYKNPISHSFGKMSRNIVHIDRGHLESPGPGNYKTYSEFGYYAVEKPKWCAFSTHKNSMTKYTEGVLSKTLQAK
jgi:hypothetical protein